MNERVSNLLADYELSPSFDQQKAIACLRRHDWLSQITPDQLEELLAGLAEREPPRPQSVSEAFLAAVCGHVVLRFRQPSARDQAFMTEAARENAALLYRRLGRSSRARQELLTLLATARSEQDLRLLAELAAADPPAVAQQFLTPLFQRRDYDPAPLFPRLLDAIEHLALAASVLDLTNYLTRIGRTPTHPAAERSGRLAALLGEITQELARIEEGADSSEDVETIHNRVNEGVALVVSLCDALALIGDTSHIGKLYQALELSHRRVRTEAAYALAKLGESAGADALVALAAEPVARLRVLAYAEELDLLDKVDEKYTTPVAKAEAELVAWLSDPMQMGIPPGRCELIDSRTQYWPSYDEPVQCFLFHFAYRLGEAVYSNVGIVGPMTHALTADLADLPPDDIYAAYAGWQAEHEEIRESQVERLSTAFQLEAKRLERRLQDAGYQNIQSVKLASFFGDSVLVAYAERDGVPGVAVIDVQDIDWRPTAQRPRPLGPDEVYWIYKGRRLLKAFNG